MEARWTRFFPTTALWERQVKSGRIGEIRTVQAEIGQGFEPIEGHRLFTPERGGGVLMDLGVYVIDFACRAFRGWPDRIVAEADFFESGVDQAIDLRLEYDGQVKAELKVSINTPMPHDGKIFGTRGNIHVFKFNRPQRFEVTAPDGSTETCGVAYIGPGYHFEANEVMQCLRNGLRESPLMPLEDTLTMMKTLDKIRESTGIFFPDTISGV